MLTVNQPEKKEIKSIRRENGSLYLVSEEGMHRLQPLNNKIIRITFTKQKIFSEREKIGVCYKNVFLDWSYEVTSNQIIVYLKELILTIDKEDLTYRYYNKNMQLLLEEIQGTGKILDEYESMVIDDSIEHDLEKVVTPDGEKTIVKHNALKKGEKLYHTFLNLKFQGTT